MITTVCLNPSFDRTVTVDALQMGQVNRIRSVRTDVGGKGVNVAVVARRLGLEARVIGCAGAEGSGKLRTALEREGVQHDFHAVEGAVRVNTKVVSLDGTGVTELNEPGPTLTAEDLDVFFDMAIDAAKGSDYVVVTGSLPLGCGAETYRELIRLMHGTRCILDVGGDALIKGVEARPFLIKPNHHELAAALGRELPTMADICRGAQELRDAGAENVLVSLGKDGALLVSREGTYYAPEIPVTVRSTVGAGDALVGGLLYGLEKYGAMRDALRCGAAAGTASVMTEGTQLIRAEDFHHLLDQVQIEEWK